ncbi:hypothetical protein JW930_00045 [Candidatus Woesearchaeota archaeon]|nr:hypothetical protein [Candidatus Woesearchaeota archaeon]
MKKAQGISINVIIVAAIALVVMIILVLIFTTNIRNWRESSQACASLGGVCVERATDCTGEYAKIIEGSCPGEDKEDPRDDGYCCYRT